VVQVPVHRAQSRAELLHAVHADVALTVVAVPRVNASEVM
jgi:hypothetical protein